MSVQVLPAARHKAFEHSGITLQRYHRLRGRRLLVLEDGNPLAFSSAVHFRLPASTQSLQFGTTLVNHPLHVGVGIGAVVEKD